MSIQFPLNDFLNQFVDGYLLHDLESMAKITLPPNQKDGAVGYPMVMTTLAGIELLGGLISPTPFSTFSGNDYFKSYWNNCIVPTDGQYQGLETLFRQLIRNGLAHSFCAKTGVLVTKVTPPVNRGILDINTTKKIIVVDCVGFYQDFRKSYVNHIKPIVNGASSLITNSTEMQNRLDEMMTAYEKDTLNQFNNFISTHPQFNIINTFISNTPISSASGMSGPITYTP